MYNFICFWNLLQISFYFSQYSQKINVLYKKPFSRITLSNGKNRIKIRPIAIVVLTDRRGRGLCFTIYRDSDVES